jgi:hypothetical protein
MISATTRPCPDAAREPTTRCDNVVLSAAEYKVGQPVTSETKHTVLAFAVAPLTTPLLWWLSFGFVSSDKLSGALGDVAFVVVSCAPVVYGVTLGVGLPIYLVIEKWSRLRFWHPILVGTLLGSVVFPLASRALAGLSSALFGALLGGASGSAFWFIWRCPTRRCSGPGPRLRSEPGR